MQNKEKEQIKEKIILASLTLLYLDPISFHSLKCLQQKKYKEKIRSKIKGFKIFCCRYVSDIVYGEKKIKKERKLLVKNSFYYFENFFIAILKKERIKTIYYILFLEDLLSI